MQQIRRLKKQQRKIQVLKRDLQQQTATHGRQLSPNAVLCLLAGGGFCAGFLWQRIKLPRLLRQAMMPSLGTLTP